MLHVIYFTVMFAVIALVVYEIIRDVKKVRSTRNYGSPLVITRWQAVVWMALLVVSLLPIAQWVALVWLSVDKAGRVIDALTEFLSKPLMRL